MWTKRLAVLLVLLWAASGASAYSQSLFVKGGMLFVDKGGDGGSTGAAQIGGKLWYTSFLQLQGAITYHDALALEGALQLRPFSHNSRIDPYLLFGFGRFVNSSSEGERAVIPLGIGADYFLTDNVSLNVEVDGRWIVNQARNGELSTDFGFMPMIGLAYDFNRARPEPDPMLASNDRLPSREGSGARTATLAGVEDPTFRDPSGPIIEDPSSRAATGSATGPVIEDPSTRAATGAPTGPAFTDPRSMAATSLDDTSRASSLGESDGMVLLPDGIFIMGLTDEDPLEIQPAGFKRVTISSFYIDKYEVTNAEWRRFLQELSPEERQAMMPDSTIWERTGNRFSWTDYFRGINYDNYPVVAVNWDQAKRYCEFYEKRLPTEAEWEYASRAGQSGNVYPWPGMEPRDRTGKYLANYNPGRGGYAADGYAFTAPVDAFPPNPWGLYNMSGNVAEWVMDSFAPTYTLLTDFNPLYEDPEEKRRIVRGGSWASDAFYIGVGVRDALPNDEASPYTGVRCATDLASYRNQ
jgi:formylglycine-generating enzyme required for sulfatase activity